MACPPIPRYRTWIRRAGCPLLAHSGQISTLAPWSRKRRRPEINSRGLPLLAMPRQRPSGSSKLREAAADRPILFRCVENVHEHVLRPDAGALTEQLRDPPKQRFLLFRRVVLNTVIRNIGAPGDAVRITRQSNERRSQHVASDRCKSTCSRRRNLHERTCCDGTRRVRPQAA